MGYVAAFVVPCLFGLAAWIWERLQRVSAQALLASRAEGTRMVEAQLAETTAALQQTKGELAETTARLEGVIGLKEARIRELEDELARNLDPLAVGERARRMLSGGAGTP